MSTCVSEHMSVHACPRSDIRARRKTRAAPLLQPHLMQSLAVMAQHLPKTASDVAVEEVALISRYITRGPGYGGLGFVRVVGDLCRLWDANN